MGTRESEDEDDPLSNTLVPPSASDALDLERQRLDIERQKLALERERLELDKARGGSGRTAAPAPEKSASSGRLPRAKKRGRDEGGLAKASADATLRSRVTFMWWFLVIIPAFFGVVFLVVRASEDHERSQREAEARDEIAKNAREGEEESRREVREANAKAKREYEDALARRAAAERASADAPPEERAPAPPPRFVEKETDAGPSEPPAPVASAEPASAPEREPEAPRVAEAPKPVAKKTLDPKLAHALTQRIVGWLAERRTLECPTCHGKVMLKCSACSGSGKISVVEVGNGADPVTKVYDCSTCKTKGIVHCWKCENGLSEITTRSIEKRWRISGPWLGSYVEKSVKVEIAEDGKNASARYTIRLANADREISEDSSWELDAKGVWQGVEIVMPKKKLKADGQK